MQNLSNYDNVILKYYYMIYRMTLTNFKIYHKPLHLSVLQTVQDGPKNCNVILLRLPGHQRKDQWELLPAAILMDKGVDAEELPGLLEGILHNLWKRNERHIKFRTEFT